MKIHCFTLLQKPPIVVEYKYTMLQDINDPGGGSNVLVINSSSLQAPECNQEFLPSNCKDFSDSDISDINNKYLHKKFKKIATTIPTEEKDDVLDDVNSTMNNISGREEETFSAIGKSNHSHVINSESKALFSDIQIKSADKANNSEENPSNEEILATYGSDILSCMSVSDRLQSAVSLSQGRYICPYCKLACAKPSVLQKHIRAHTNERPYPCRPCGFSFKTRSNLYKHCRSRTHALKVVGEEVNISGYVSHKTVCAIMDSSDIDDEDDDTNIVPPPSSCLSLHNACAARLQGPYTLSDISSVPRESKNNQERSRQIYKPKFHKAALYYNEEESEHCYKKESSDPRIVTSTSSPSPSFTPSQNLGMSESHVTVPSPTSEYFQWQLKTSVNEVEVKVHKNNSASVETFKRNPASSDHITESSRSPSFPSSFPAESYNYLSSSSIAAENSAVLSAASKETKKLNFFDQHTYQSKLASPQFISLECLSPCLKIGSSNMSSQKNKYFQCTQPLNLSTTDETNKGGNDTNHRKRSYSEDIPITLKTYEHHTLPNQETCENCDGHSKLNAKIAKFDQVKLLAEYEGRIETSPENAFSNSQNLKGSFMNDLLLKEQDTPAMGNLMSCSSIYNHTDILPRVALKADTFNVPFSHLASLIPSESYCPCGVGFKTVDSLDICQCLYCQKHKNYDSNCPLSQENFNPVVMCCCTQNQPLFSPILEEMREVDSLSLRGEPVTQRCCVKSQLLLKESLKNNSVSTHSSDNSKSASLVLPPIPSPGPLLGNTHLVDGYHIYEKSKNCDTNTDEFEEQNRRQFFPKRRCLDSDVSSRETNSATSSPDLRSLSITAMPKIPYTPGPVSTLKSLEELSKNPLRPNSLQMFGGEVQIVDGAGETTTMRIEPTLHGNNAGIASLNPSDVVLKLTNNLTPNNLFLNTAENNENDVDKTGRNSPHIVVTIAKSGLNSGGTIVQVPQKSSSLASANMLSANVIKSCKSPNGNMHLRDLSPLLKSSSPLQSPLQNNSVSGGGVVNISSQFECSCTKGLASNTATVTDAYPDTTKLLVPIVPNIPTPNLAVPGIPAPTFGHDMPFMPSSSVRKDRSLLNPLNDITAFNPLTLQAHSSLFYSLPQRVDSVGTKETPKENKTQYSTVPQETLVPPFPGCAVTIFHGGRYIPYVPGIPGPQSLLCNVPHKMSLKNETLPKPLDLASPSKDSKSDFLFPNNQSKNFKCHILKPSEASAITRNVTDCHNTQQSKNCFGKNTGTLSQKCDSESPAKLHVKSKSLPAKLNTSLNHSSHPSTSCESKYVLHPSPSLPFFSQNMMSTQVADIVNAMPAKRLANTKIISEPVCLSLCKKNVEINEDRINESERLCSIGERETNRIEFKSETCGTEENTEIAAKFRRPTSLPLKPETFVPIRNQSSGLMSEGTVLPLVSPETPRPKKSYGQLYLNGYVFTFLTLKISTKPFFCILTRTQPMYAMQSPENPKLSMYSDWRDAKWKNALEYFRKHENLSYHKTTTIKFSDFLSVMSGEKQSVELIVDSARASQIQENREKIVPIVETAILLARQGITLRGHRDNGPFDVEQEPEENEGNFKAILRAKISAGDVDLKKRFDTCSSNASYTSRRMQNEILNACRKIIVNKIATEVNAAMGFALLGDETADISNTEQLAVCVRYVKEGQPSIICEHFLCFTHIHDLTGEGIAGALISTLETCNIDKYIMRGQGYDGAACMSGIIRGTQSYIQSQVPEAIYVHCAAHSLNLAIYDTHTHKSIRNCLGTVEKIYTFFNTPKRQHLLQNILSANTENIARSKPLQLCPTRWVHIYEAIMVLCEMLETVIRSLGGIENWKDKEALFGSFLLRSAILQPQSMQAVENAVLAVKDIRNSSEAEFRKEFDREILLPVKKISQFLQLSEFYKNNLQDKNEGVLTAELRSAIGVLDDCNKDIFSNVNIALKIFATLPVSTATPERSFSTLRHLKTYLRSTMGHDRFVDLAAVNIHRQINLSSEEVNDILQKTGRRLLEFMLYASILPPRFCTCTFYISG
ncbi:hypothetical protein PR048_011704 [Dryococelus australis]|uniref:C2H2-type domain-containing protein n=1 Tax=Dryococelus australis TaxID=614101 RepID=A0ABQ9HMC9_9NEOP|nr:hypothetical protein PR048_011704 [Dryococelus australis]